MTPQGIWTVQNKSENRFLHKKTADFVLPGNRKEIQALIKKMRETMRAARGIGLSANQIGLNHKVFVAEVPDEQGTLKFYTIFNPIIEKTMGTKAYLEEGCLSVPRIYGEVERYEKVTLRGLDKNGKQLKIKAWGLLAHVFQHEVDHLNGVVFIDKAKRLHELDVPEK